MERGAEAEGSGEDAPVACGAEDEEGFRLMLDGDRPPLRFSIEMHDDRAVVRDVAYICRNGHESRFERVTISRGNPLYCKGCAAVIVSYEPEKFLGAVMVGNSVAVG